MTSAAPDPVLSEGESPVICPITVSHPDFGSSVILGFGNRSSDVRDQLPIRRNLGIGYTYLIDQQFRRHASGAIQSDLRHRVAFNAMRDWIQSVPAIANRKDRPIAYGRRHLPPAIVGADLSRHRAANHILARRRQDIPPPRALPRKAPPFRNPANPQSFPAPSNYVKDTAFRHNRPWNESNASGAGGLSGFYDQVERQTDADLMVEYEDACAEFGEDSPESRRLEHRVKEIQTRRSAIT